MFDWIFYWLNHPVTPWITAAAVLLWGGSAWYLLLGKYLLPLGKEIRKMVHLLDQTPADPKAFAKYFNQLDRDCNALILLAPGWNGFTRGLIHTQDENQTILSGRRPEEFFHVTPLANRHPAATLASATPTYLAGAGLLFTFLGLVGGLYFTAQGVMTDDLAVSQKALQGLLGAASFKFISSIAGFLAAGIFSWRLRHWQQQLASDLDTLCRMLLDRMEFISKERLIYDQLRATRQLQVLLSGGVGEELLSARTQETREQTLELIGNAFVSLENRLAERTPLVMPALETGSWQAFLVGLRREGQNMVREMGQTLQEIQARAAQPSAQPMLTRPEQESWMRIIDRMELAAQALERQAVAMEGFRNSPSGVKEAGEVVIPVAKSALIDKETMVHSDPIVQEATERLHALLGLGDHPRELAAYPALMALRGQVARVLRDGRAGPDPHSAELARRVAALIQALEEPERNEADPDPKGLAQLADHYVQKRGRA